MERARNCLKGGGGGNGIPKFGIPQEKEEILGRNSYLSHIRNPQRVVASVAIFLNVYVSHKQTDAPLWQGFYYRSKEDLKGQPFNH